MSQLISIGMSEFKLDFTKSVPYRYCPDPKKASQLYLQHLANAPMDIEFRKVRTGIFNITVYSERDRKRLEDKKIKYDFGEKVNEMITASIPLIQIKKKQFYENRPG